ncbi:hypothetical protein PL9214291154 [Planktothrix tepida PCC 9214]|uniref:Uncharacterized protein n=1 Tax=Planktothrix tepida PCC 9214 TaxID=671072 RepID=A0A1J1LGC0_9CYAN|nr:hypothetical protein PL9214291154 [Planktothrix tepida PCC 9214]
MVSPKFPEDPLCYISEDVLRIELFSVIHSLSLAKLCNSILPSGSPIFP